MANTRVSPRPKPARPRHYVKEWRQYRSLTQEQLAERIGKTHGAISQLERGLVDYTQGMIEALAYALRCEPGDLLSVNPLVAGEVVDITALLRGAPDLVKQQALAAARAVLQTGTGGVTGFYRSDDAEIEGPQEVRRTNGDAVPRKQR